MPRPRLVSYTHNKTSGYGLVSGDGLIALAPHFADLPNLRASVACV